MTEPSAP